MHLIDRAAEYRPGYNLPEGSRYICGMTGRMVLCVCRDGHEVP